jgi:flagellar biosynthesis/type III secretory pathway M-ring protein FliF/YscJ
MSESLTIALKDITVSSFPATTDDAGSASRTISNNGLIIGAVAGGVILVAIVLTVILILIRRRRRLNENSPDEVTHEPEDTTEFVMSLEDIRYGDHVFMNPLDEFGTVEDAVDSIEWSDASIDEESNGIPLGSLDQNDHSGITHSTVP